jgi:hypothetical protein
LTKFLPQWLRTFSLRGLLLLVTFVAAGLAWTLHIRPSLVIGSSRLDTSSCEYVDTFFLFDLPTPGSLRRCVDDWYYARFVAYPRIQKVTIDLTHEQPPTLDAITMARAAREVEFRFLHDEGVGAKLGVKSWMTPCVSENTRHVLLRCEGTWNGYLPLSSDWLEQCPYLTELTLDANPAGDSLLADIGQRSGGCTTLNFRASDYDEAHWCYNALDQLASHLSHWRKLKHLYVREAVADDCFIGRVCESCPNLESLEIEAPYGQEKILFTARGLEPLTKLKRLTCLRLDNCGISSEHIPVIARLRDLKRLSLESEQLSGEDIEPLRELKRLEYFLEDWRPSEYTPCSQCPPFVVGQSLTN